MTSTWAAILDWLKAVWPSIVGGVKLLVAVKTGQALQQGKDAADALQDIELAAKAASGVDLLTAADVVHVLQERGMYRIRSK